MRRIGAGANRRAGSRLPSAERAPLMDWAVGGTFTRATTGTIRPTDSSVQTVASGARRIERGRLLVELATIYVQRYSEDLTQANWVKTNCTVTSNAVLAPDGAMTADAVVTTATGVVTSISETVATAPSGNTAFMFWVRGDSTFTGSYTYTSTASVSSDFTVTTEWRQVYARTTGTVGPTLTIRPHSGAGTGTAGVTMYVWGINMINTSLGSSYYPNTSVNVTRNADTLTYASGAWNPELVTRGFEIDWVPNWDSGGINNVCDILSFGGSTNRLSVSNVDSVQVVVAGIVYLATSAFSWSRDQKITFRFDSVAGTVTITGATTGDGTYSGTPWSSAISTAQTLRVGGRVASTAECCGALSNPRPL